MRKLSVFIGRFSPFHLGHEEVLLKALQSSEVVLLLIGSSFTARNIKNPLTYSERAEIIMKWHARRSPGTTLVVKPLLDHPYNDPAWIRKVQDKVLSTKEEYNIPLDSEVFLVGANRDKSTWYLETFGGFFTKDLSTVSKDINATSIREEFFVNDNIPTTHIPVETRHFLLEFMSTEKYYGLVKEYEFINKYKESWAKAPFPPTFVCVDTVVIQSGHVLVVVRDSFPGKGLWALPGGFVGQNETLKDAAIRELREETSIELSPAQLYGSMVDKETFDHPDRSTRGRTITTCYTLKLRDDIKLPRIKPQLSEVKKVMWVPIAEALCLTDKWYEDHNAILETMVYRIKS